MGYWVRYSFHNVRILAPQAGAALAAIHALYLPETIEKFGTALICDRTTHTPKKFYRGGRLPPAGGFATLMEALWEWSLGTVQLPDGSIEMVAYRCDKAGDEGVLFDAIAPFLDYSCSPHIDAFQENNEHWRHVFADGQHRQVPGTVIFADQYPELFDSLES